jgi:hypothetical protein
MSIAVSYFFNYDGEIAMLADEIHQALGIRFLPQAEDTWLYWQADLLGMDWHLGEHDYEDDGGIVFSSFRYELEIKTFWPNAHLRPLQMSVMAKLPYLLFASLKLTGILVYDLQRLMGQFEKCHSIESQPVLVESLSGLIVEAETRQQLADKLLAQV